MLFRAGSTVCVAKGDQEWAAPVRASLTSAAAGDGCGTFVRTQKHLALLSANWEYACPPGRLGLFPSDGQTGSYQLARRVSTDKRACGH
jgi:hypothetical protein